MDEQPKNGQLSADEQVAQQWAALEQRAAQIAKEEQALASQRLAFSAQQQLAQMGLPKEALALVALDNPQKMQQTLQTLQTLQQQLIGRASAPRMADKLPLDDRQASYAQRSAQYLAEHPNLY